MSEEMRVFYSIWRFLFVWRLVKFFFGSHAPSRGRRTAEVKRLGIVDICVRGAKRTEERREKEYGGRGFLGGALGRGWVDQPIAIQVSIK